MREYTFSRLDLHDGGDYTVNLIVCNGAKICVEDESREITIDSSPPTPGIHCYRFFFYYCHPEGSQMIGMSKKCNMKI